MASGGIWLYFKHRQSVRQSTTAGLQYRFIVTGHRSLSRIWSWRISVFYWVPFLSEMQSADCGRSRFIVFAYICLIIKICDTSELNMCSIECYYSCRFLTIQCWAVLETLYYNKISHVQLVVLAIVVDKICLFCRTEYPFFRWTNRSFRIKVTVRVRLRIGGDTATSRMGT